MMIKLRRSERITTSSMPPPDAESTTHIHPDQSRSTAASHKPAPPAFPPRSPSTVNTHTLHPDRRNRNTKSCHHAPHAVPDPGLPADPRIHTTCSTSKMPPPGAATPNQIALPAATASPSRSPAHRDRKPPKQACRTPESTL